MSTAIPPSEAAQLVMKFWQVVLDVPIDACFLDPIHTDAEMTEWGYADCSALPWQTRMAVALAS